MAVLRDGGLIGPELATVDATKALRVSEYPPGRRFYVAGQTGTIAAANCTANSQVFVAYLSPRAGADYVAQISKLTVYYQTIVAYTVPITVGRRLHLHRGGLNLTAGGAITVPSTGTALGAMPAADSQTPEPSYLTTVAGGDIRIAAAAILTLSNYVKIDPPLAVMPLSHLGAAGAFGQWSWENDNLHTRGIVLRPGEGISIGCGVGMDAAGTWTLGVTMEWSEGIIPQFIL
jgi:hypothetical protein